MAPRALWKGQLRLSLVSIPVEVYSATKTLRYADEIREADSMFSEISDDTADKDLLEVAVSLIDRKTKPFDPAAYSDAYNEALKDLLEAKRKDKKAPRVSTDDNSRASGEDNVVDLMTALKQSLEKTETTKKKSGGRRKKAS